MLITTISRYTDEFSYWQTVCLHKEIDMNDGEICYLADDDVDKNLDLELRELLFSCFKQQRFADRRFCHEMPEHRWIVRDESGTLVAHMAVHEKTIVTSAGPMEIGGVAEVCVHESQRGHGWVKRMLKDVHIWMRDRGLLFSLLFGNHNVYSSSGYVPVTNVTRCKEENGDEKCKQRSGFMMCPLGDTLWPEGEIDLCGSTF
jgi:predicted acetyltransferase